MRSSRRSARLHNGSPSLCGSYAHEVRIRGLGILLDTEEFKNCCD
ncbi:hypothetical protein ACFCXR_21985 [Streptomyces noursei]